MTAFTPEQMRALADENDEAAKVWGLRGFTLPTPPLSAPPPTNSTRCGICCSSAAIGSLAVAASNGQSMTTTSLTQSSGRASPRSLTPTQKRTSTMIDLALYRLSPCA